MVNRIKKELARKVGDEKLVDALLLSFQKISEKYISHQPIELLQNVGLFLESAMRVVEHFVTGNHTPLQRKFNLDVCIKKLENLSGREGLRIHVSRLSRAIYDFRSRKKSIHLKAVDPKIIDASLAFNACNWILIELLKESGIPDAESTIKILSTRKIPLVQRVGGVLRTTNPKLTGTQRILLLLYSEIEGMDVGKLWESTKLKIKTKNHLNKNLKNLESRDCLHLQPNGKWVIFGRGYKEAEQVMGKFSE